MISTALARRTFRDHEEAGLELGPVTEVDEAVGLPGCASARQLGHLAGGWRIWVLGSVGEAERWGQAGVVANDLGVVGRVEPVESVPVGLDLALREDDLLGRVDLDDLVVELVADQDVAALEHDGPGGQWHGHAAGPG